LLCSEIEPILWINPDLRLIASTMQFSYGIHTPFAVRKATNWRGPLCGKINANSRLGRRAIPLKGAGAAPMEVWRHTSAGEDQSMKGTSAYARPAAVKHARRCRTTPASNPGRTKRSRSAEPDVRAPTDADPVASARAATAPARPTRLAVRLARGGRRLAL